MSLVIVCPAGVFWCRPDGCRYSGETLANHLVQEIRRTNPCAVLFVGITSTEALEMACRLRDQIEQGTRIGILDSLREISKTNDPCDVPLAGLCARLRSPLLDAFAGNGSRRFIIDMPGRGIRNGTTASACSPSEFRLLTLLLRYPRIVFSRMELLRRISTNCLDIDVRMIDVLIHRLRRKIERDRTFPEHLLSVRGIGYIFQHNSDVFIDSLTGGRFLSWPCCVDSQSVTKF